MQVDPHLGKQSLPASMVNAYSYCANNPWNLTDPTGKSFLSFIGKFFTGIAIAIASAFTGGLAAAFAIGAVGGASALGAVGSIAIGALAGAIAGAAKGAEMYNQSKMWNPVADGSGDPMSYAQNGEWTADQLSEVANAGSVPGAKRISTVFF